MNFRKLLGIKPKKGDKVRGYLDYGVEYEGVVTETPTSKHFPVYKVNGKTTINGKVDKECEFTVTKNRISHY